MPTARVIGSVATLSDHCRLTLPDNVRDELGLAPGDQVEFFQTGPDRFIVYASGRLLRMPRIDNPNKKPVPISDMRMSAKRGHRR